MAKSSFLRHAAVYGAGEVLVSAASFLLLPLYVRALSPEEYGALDYLNRLGEIVLLCLLFNGLRQALFSFQNQARDESERRAVVGSALFLTLLFLGGGGGLVALAAEPLCRRFDLGAPGLLRLAILAVVLESVAMLLLALAQARQKSFFFVAVSLGQFLLRILLCIVLVTLLRWGIKGALIASVIASGASALYLLGLELARGGLRVERKQLRAMFWFSFPFVPGGLGFFLLNSGDRFFLKQHVGLAELGVYALGYKLALVVKMLSRQPLYKVWSAQMYEAARRPDAADVFGKVFTRILTVYAGVGLALCLVAGEVVSIIAGERYAAAAGIIAPVALAYFFLTAADLMESGFYIKRKTAYKLPVTLASTAVTLSLYMLLIPVWGIQGAALATLLGFLFTAAMTGIMAQRVFVVHYEWGRVGGLLAWAVGVWLLGTRLPESLWMLPFKMVLWFGWLGLMWFTVLSAEEKEWARGLIKKVDAWRGPPTAGDAVRAA